VVDERIDGDDEDDDDDDDDDETHATPSPHTFLCRLLVMSSVGQKKKPLVRSSEESRPL